MAGACASLIFGIYSCKKNNFEPQNQNSNQESNSVVNSKRSGFSLNYSNSSNSYDNIGVEHNNFLNYLVANNEEGNTYLEFIQSFEEYQKTLGDTIPWEDTIYDNNKFAFNDYIQLDLGDIVNDMDGFFNEGCTNGDYSADVRDYLKDLVHEVNTNMTCTSCTLQTFVQTKLDNIKSIEAEIKNSGSLNSDEKEHLLKSSSVLRHSFAFWVMTARDSDNDWGIAHIEDTGDLDLANGIPGWVSADLTGLHLSYTTNAVGWGFTLGPWGGPAVALGFTTLASVAYALV